ncbi:MAG: hypothetical protein MZV63_04445 [Marinilabiliales bacterium]|nr:hypothetical protein [Marinilabiliales bacterium]
MHHSSPSLLKVLSRYYSRLHGHDKLDASRRDREHRAAHPLRAILLTVPHCTPSDIPAAG